MLTFIYTVCAIVASGSFYLVLMALKHGEYEGLWLFLAFGVFFSAPLVAAGLRLVKRRPAPVEDEPPRPVRFVPHVQLMTMLVVAAVAIILAIVLPLILKK